MPTLSVEVPYDRACAGMWVCWDVCVLGCECAGLCVCWCVRVRGLLLQEACIRHGALELAVAALSAGLHVAIAMSTTRVIYTLCHVDTSYHAVCVNMFMLSELSLCPPSFHAVVCITSGCSLGIAAFSECATMLPYSNMPLRS